MKKYLIILFSICFFDFLSGDSKVFFSIYNKANFLFYNRNMNEAIILFRKAFNISDGINKLQVADRLVEIYFLEGDFRNARYYINFMLKSNNKWFLSKGRKYLLRLYLSKGELDKAEKLIKTLKGDSDIYYLEGKLLIRIGKIKAGIEKLEKYYTIKKDPDVANELFRLYIGNKILKEKYKKWKTMPHTDLFFLIASEVAPEDIFYICKSKIKKGNIDTLYVNKVLDLFFNKKRFEYVDKIMNSLKSISKSHFYFIKLKLYILRDKNIDKIKEFFDDGGIDFKIRKNVFKDFIYFLKKHGDINNLELFLSEYYAFFDCKDLYLEFLSMSDNVYGFWNTIKDDSVILPVIKKYWNYFSNDSKLTIYKLFLKFRGNRLYEKLELCYMLKNYDEILNILNNVKITADLNNFIKKLPYEYYIKIIGNKWKVVDKNIACEWLIDIGKYYESFNNLKKALFYYEKFQSLSKKSLNNIVLLKAKLGLDYNKEELKEYYEIHYYFLNDLLYKLIDKLEAFNVELNIDENLMLISAYFQTNPEYAEEFLNKLLIENKYPDYRIRLFYVTTKINKLHYQLDADWYKNLALILMGFKILLPDMPEYKILHILSGNKSYLDDFSDIKDFLCVILNKIYRIKCNDLDNNSYFGRFYFKLKR